MPSRNLPTLFILAIVTAAAVLRLDGLAANSFDPGEIAIVDAALHPLHVKTTSLRRETLPLVLPLPVWATRVAMRGGDDEVTCRLPSVVAGVLTVVGVWSVGGFLLSAEAALYASLGMAFSPLHVALSRSVGSDVWLVLFATMCATFFSRAIAHGRAPWRWALFVALFVLALFSSPCAVFLLPAFVPAALVPVALVPVAAVPAGLAHPVPPGEPDRSGVRISIPAVVAIAIAAAFAVAWSMYQPSQPPPSFFRIQPRWSMLLPIVTALGAGEANTALAGLGLLLCALAGSVRTARSSAPGFHAPRSAILLGAWVVAGVVGLILRGWWLQLQFRPEQVALVLPAYLLLCGAGLQTLRQIVSRVISSKRSRWIPYGLVAVLLVGLEGPALRAQLRERSPAWRDAAAVVERNARHDDAVVVLQERQSFLFYAPDLEGRVDPDVRSAVVPAYFVHPERGWLIAPTNAGLYPGWVRIKELFERYPPVHVSPGGGVEVFYLGSGERDKLLLEAAHFELPSSVLVHGDLLLELFQGVGAVPALLWKVDQIALSRDPLNVRNPALLSVVNYLAHHGQGDRAASLAFRLATAEPDWPEAQATLAAFRAPPPAPTQSR